MRRWLLPRLLSLGIVLIGGPRPALAILDVEDRGPLMDAGNFRMRVTNAGILGNAFYNVGRSSDPSFEYPAYSGIELLNHADLWIGAIDANGETHVSGGPMLEWRPTLDPNDRVLLRRRSDLGSKRGVDDDGDGKIDEEILNGKDDDGDGEIDEDLGVFADQVAAADYVDDRPEAVSFGYSTGESHVPLGLSVHQETYAWGEQGYDGVCAINFHVTNHGVQQLQQVYMGMLADLDVRRVSDPSGHRKDKVEWRTYSASKFEGLSNYTVNGVRQCGGPPPCPPKQCFSNFSATVPVVESAIDPSMPVIALMPLDHTLDPITRIAPDLGHAPIQLSFMTEAYNAEGIPGEGGVPALDTDRYSALAGQYPSSSATGVGDWIVLLSCGPFRALGPGESLDFTMALVAAPNADSLEATMGRLALLKHGVFADLLPNETAHPESADYSVALTGVSGHELCLEPPPGHTFTLDVDCTAKIPNVELLGTPPTIRTIQPGHCVWTDLDCEECTGLNGKETEIPWLDPGEIPPSPSVRITPGDHQVELEWDNMPEVLIDGGQMGAPGSQFIGYRVYKLAKWNPRESLLPPRANWALLGTYGVESGNQEIPLASATDTTLDYTKILYEQRLYPVGRYRVVDRDVLDGFDYVYAISTVYDQSTPVASGAFQKVRLETPLIARFQDRVTPHAASLPAAGAVTVVPNPYRATAGWDRVPVFGDPQPRHLDFMHLPKALCTIKIYTLAGDFVQQLTHDGRGGDGQMAWDLISRNGQDVESGVYLFTVDSPLGHQIGKFVLIR